MVICQHNHPHSSPRRPLLMEFSPSSIHFDPDVYYSHHFRLEHCIEDILRQKKEKLILIQLKYKENAGDTPIGENIRPA